MQRYMKAQSVASGGDGNLDSMNQAVLEINPKHPIVQDLQMMVKTDKESEETKNFAMLVYDVASMTGGYEVSDTGAFASRVMNMMTSKAKQDVEESDEVIETAETVIETAETVEDDDKPIEPEVIA